MEPVPRSADAMLLERLNETVMKNLARIEDLSSNQANISQKLMQAEATVSALPKSADIADDVTSRVILKLETIKAELIHEIGEQIKLYTETELPKHVDSLFDKKRSERIARWRTQAYGWLTLISVFFGVGGMVVGWIAMGG